MKIFSWLEQMAKWPNLGSVMQILYVEKLQSLGYEQHTYAIMEKNVCQ